MNFSTSAVQSTRIDQICMFCEITSGANQRTKLSPFCSITNTTDDGARPSNSSLATQVSQKCSHCLKPRPAILPPLSLRTNRIKTLYGLGHSLSHWWPQQANVLGTFRRAISMISLNPRQVFVTEWYRVHLD